MFQCLEEIILDDRNFAKERYLKSRYSFSFFQSFFKPDYKIEYESKEKKYFTLFFDEFREDLSLDEYLLFNALRCIDKRYVTNIKRDLFNFSRQENYFSFNQIFDNLEEKGYISVENKPYRYKIGNEYIFCKEKSNIKVKCLNPFGVIINYEF